MNVPRRSARGRPRRFDDRREEVLRTAARIFSEYGFRYATLEDVGRSLGISRPALYHYAKSKDELLMECAKVAFAELREALRLAELEPNGLAQVRAFFERYAEIICDDFGQCFVLTDRRELNDPEKEFTRVGQLELGLAVEAMIKRGVKDRSIRKCEAADASRALFGAFNGLPRWRHPGSKRTPSQVAKSFLTLMTEGLSAKR